MRKITLLTSVFLLLSLQSKEQVPQKEIISNEPKIVDFTEVKKDSVQMVINRKLNDLAESEVRKEESADTLRQLQKQK